MSEETAMRVSKLGRPWPLFLTLVVGTACGSAEGGGNAASLDYVQPYTLECTQTTCEKQEADCRARDKQECDDCFTSCSSPYQSDPSGCAAICHDVCAPSDCYSCTAPKDQCATQGVRFDPPPLNTELRDVSARYVMQCGPAVSAELLTSLADFYGRSCRHEVSAVFECILTKGCSASAACSTFTSGGSVGTALCGRQQACGAPCADGTAAYIDEVEPLLRPALVAELARCSRESDCATASACWIALQPALNLAAYPSVP